MVIQLQSMMVRPITKGFTLIESLFVFSIILLLSSLTIPYHHFQLDDPNYEVLHIYTTQTKAMITKEKQEYDHSITFNSMGNINHAATIGHDHYDIVLQLGSGRFYIQKKND